MDRLLELQAVQVHAATIQVYHSLFCRTLRDADEDGFLTTIQSIIEVANASEYLLKSVTSRL